MRTTPEYVHHQAKVVYHTSQMIGNAAITNDGALKQLANIANRVQPSVSVTNHGCDTPLVILYTHGVDHAIDAVHDFIASQNISLFKLSTSLQAL